MITDDLLQRAEQGDLDALATLDCQGLLMGADESLQEYADRLRALKANIGRMNADLASTQSYTVEDLTVEAKDRIPTELFVEPQQLTDKLYGFQIDWVPGFFITPIGVLFGGCAYYFFPDFFALFIIRKAFAERDRWLIYRRSELLSHELCHIARIGMGSTEYEEVFAYRTSQNGFRRFFGGIFRTQWDSFSFLGSAFVILLGRLLQIFRFHSLLQWPFWVPFIVCFIYQIGRHIFAMRRLDRAREAISRICPENGDSILFRCTDAEIHDLAGMTDQAQAQAWVDQRCEDSWRWRAIRHRFIETRPDNT